MRGEAQITCPYTKFNKYFKTFVRELGKTYPDVSEYKWMLAGYKVLKTINKKFPYKLWSDCITEDIVAAIFRKDDSYFFRPDFHIKGYDNVTQMMKREWPRVDAHSRDMIWQHMMCLVALAQHCA